MRCTSSVLGVCIALAASVTSALAQTTTLCSVDSSGMQGDWHSDAPMLSADGRYVAFYSLASNLTPGDPNQTYDAFLRDRATGVTLCVSVNASGNTTNGMALPSAISGDGRYVVFFTTGAGIVPNDLNDNFDVYRYDNFLSLWARASVDPAGGDPNASCFYGSISDDGRWVAYESAATNIVTGDTNNHTDVFLRDMTSFTTKCVSKVPHGAQANDSSYYATLSADARYVAFSSRASNLVANDTNGVADMFVLDQLTDTLQRVSVDSSGSQGNGLSEYGTLSADGNCVVFASAASNLVANDTNGLQDVFLRDLSSAQTLRVSVDSTGAQANGVSSAPQLSGDGRFITFLSKATSLVAGDNNNRDDAFLHDRVTGNTRRVSVGSGGVEGNKDAYSASISRNGLLVGIDSLANNLVPGDTNNSRDVFVHDRFARPTGFCTSGLTTNGCAPVITTTGSPSASASSGFTIGAVLLEGQRSGLIFYGVSGATAIPWAAGSTSFLCVKTPTQRTPAQSTGGTLSQCDGAMSIDFLAFMAATPNALGQPILFGQRYDAQAWFRDPPAPKTTNLSNAVEFELLP